MPRSRQPAETLHILLLSFFQRGKAMSGYDIAAWLKQPAPLIWPVKHSQIYPALAALEAREDIAGDWKEQRGRPAKKSYRITKQGRARLLAWLQEPRPSMRQEEAMLIAYNHKLVGSRAAGRALASYRTQVEDDLAQLAARWSAIEAYAADDMIGVRAPFEFAVMVGRARIAWCDWFAAEIGRHSVPSAAARPDGCIPKSSVPRSRLRRAPVTP